MRLKRLSRGGAEYAFKIKLTRFLFIVIFQIENVEG